MDKYKDFTYKKKGTLQIDSDNLINDLNLLADLSDIDFNDLLDRIFNYDERK